MRVGMLIRLIDVLDVRKGRWRCCIVDFMLPPAAMKRYCRLERSMSIIHRGLGSRRGFVGGRRSPAEGKGGSQARLL